MSINQTIADFTTYTIASGGYMELDRQYVQNKISTLIGLEDFIPATPSREPESISILSDRLVDFAVTKKVIGKSALEKQQLLIKLMDLLTPPPSVINALFAEQYAKKPETATDYLYRLVQMNQTVLPNLQISFDGKKNETPYVYLAHQLSKLKNEPSVESSQSENIISSNCSNCFYNEGAFKIPSLIPTQRILRMNVGGASWGFTYPSLTDFIQGGLLFTEQHQSLKLDAETLKEGINLLNIFPHYFIGFDIKQLRKTHGCLLSGINELPLLNAKITKYFLIKNHPAVVAGIVDWPLSVVRLAAQSSEELLSAISVLLENLDKEQIMPNLLLYKQNGAYTMDVIFHNDLTALEQVKNSDIKNETLLGLETGCIFIDNNSAFKNINQDILNEQADALLYSLNYFKSEEQLAQFLNLLA